MDFFRRCSILLALLTAGCGQSAVTPTTTTAPTAPSTVTQYAGTLQPQGTNFYSFLIGTVGYIEITLLDVVPLNGGQSAPVTVGLGIGAPTTNAAGTTSCTLTYSVNAQAGSTAQIVGTAQAVTVCVSIYDPGTLTGPIDYAFTVAHP